MAAPVRLHVRRLLKRHVLINVRKVISAKRLHNKSYSRNILELHDRGLFKTIFPSESSPELIRHLIGSAQCIYCGFDPTADSLHIGNLLAIISLLHCQRRGHQPLAVVGGATAHIGDPSGQSKDRSRLTASTIEDNVQSISNSLQRIFYNHEQHIRKNNKHSLSPIKILNNADWYKDINVIEFLSKIGHHFRLGPMLSRHSVKSRIQSEEGISFQEFSYQIFQAFDWLHLLREYNCAIQIGGNDQIGNMVSGYELISKLTDKKVFGLTVPLITTASGSKIGKTAGNAIWLNPDKTTPYELYQYFLNLPDTEVELYLKLFTFLQDKEIQSVLQTQKLHPEKRPGQKMIAEQVTLLVHGESGVEMALRWTDAFFSGKAESLVALSQSELTALFASAPTIQLLQEPGMSILDVCMKAKCFNREVDARRTIGEGGVRLNHRRITEPDFVLIQGEHILSNNITLIRIGKKSYYVVKWIN